MTPLTHAAVGTAICQQVRKLRWGAAGWLAALALAFFSHFLLDAIPHFESLAPIENYKHNLTLTLGLAAAGALPALWMMRKNREAGRIWLVLFLWIGLGFYSWSWWRVGTAALGLAYIGWKNPDRRGVLYAAAGMLAVLPDLFPPSFKTMAALHHRMHYPRDWAVQIYRHFVKGRIPVGLERLHSPYFLLGYAVELLMEGTVFLAAAYLFSGERFPAQREEPAGLNGDLALSAEIGESRH